jgi:hypothetical protein
MQRRVAQHGDRPCHQLLAKSGCSGLARVPSSMALAAAT